MHLSWFFALAGFGFVSGVWLASIFNSSHAALLICGLIFTVTALGFRLVVLIPVSVAGALLIGLVYGSVNMGDRSVYSNLIGNTVKITGLIKEDPTTSASGVYMQLKNVYIEDHSLVGSVFVSVSPSKNLLRGDIVTVEGEVSEGFGSFPASIKRAKLIKHVRPSPGDIGRRVRDWFADNVRSLIDEPQASLGVGFLTGQKSALPEDLSESLRIAGLTHIVVASGYNLTILVRLSRRLFSKVSKFMSAVSASSMIVSFVSMTGLSPSMTRAGLVSALSLLTWYHGYRFSPFVLLPLAAAITVFVEPGYVWGDMGWQLSFAAFTGVMIVSPLVQRYFFGNKDPGMLRQVLGETISAHIVTVPIIALQFGEMSNVAVFANLMIVPLVPLAMLMTFIVGMVAITNAGVLSFLAIPTQWLLTYMTSTATFLSELDWAQSEIQLEWWGWLAYLIILAAICVWMWRVTKYNFMGKDNLQT